MKIVNVAAAVKRYRHYLLTYLRYRHDNKNETTCFLWGSDRHFSSDAPLW